MDFRQIAHLSRSISARRLNNARRIYQSYHSSRRKGEARVNGMPFSLSLEPTTSCNLRCPECPSGLRSFSRPTGMLDSTMFQSIMDELGPDLIYLILYFQGEPYLNPSIFDFIETAHRHKVYSAISTNAHYLTPEKSKRTVEAGLSRLIISIDGTTQETYSSYRIGGSLEKVIEGTKNMVSARKEAGKGPEIVFQFLVVKPNEHQMNDVQGLGKELGVDKVLFKSAQVYDYENGNPLIPSDDKYARYRQKADGSWEIKNKMLNQCWRMWHSAVITWDGQVVPCCFDKDASHGMGKVGEQSFREIWNGEAYNSFRNALLKGRDQIDICTNCTEGTNVWV